MDAILKMQMRYSFLLIVSMVFLYSCIDLFQYSPNAISLDESQKDLNRKNYEELLSKEGDDTVRFVFAADTQFATDELKILVDQLNNIEGIDFMLLAGDLVQKGTSKEYKWLHRELERLNIPYFGIVGNHDFERNAENIFEAMFGERDFSFEYKHTKFICIDTNSKEWNWNGKVPDISWLQSEIDAADANDDIDKVYVISHVAPYDHVFFDAELEYDFANAIGSSPKVIASLHSHSHKWKISRPYPDKKIYLQVTSVKQVKENKWWQRSYGLISVSDTTIFKYKIY
ncbi:MAG: metallophosphoesterase [Reichenbachiella sp.]|uniref:metallophosphoesterase family protein n=1 Tax=Reichenbachiella sp. TaxID=2184521 RepID=UPI00329963C0